MNYLEPIDLNHPEFGDLFDELPLWSAPFGLRLLDRVPMRPGLTILDVGCGTGFLTVELAQRCGPTAKVIAVDPWPAAMNRLRRKLASLGLDNVELLEQDASTLDLPAASVDLVVSNLGINNFEEPAAVLGTLHRLAKPGAGLFLTTNLEGHMAEFYEVFRATLIDQGQGDRLAALHDHIRHRGTVDSVSGLLQQAGFAVVKVETDSFRMRFADGSSMLRHFLIRLGFVPAWASVVAADRQQITFEALERGLNALAAQQGELSLTIPMACIEARKPAVGENQQKSSAPSNP
jgi:ubiquinone/menaquinone biosynthesis C-methylase UbiE